MALRFNGCGMRRVAFASLVFALLALALAAQVAADTSATPLLHTARVTGVSEQWREVRLPHRYSSPVVVATVHRPGTGSKPAVARVRNAAGDRFELRVQQATRPGEVVLGATYDVEYLVVEAGVYTQAEHGLAMEAAIVNSTRTDGKFAGGWQGQVRSYQNAYVNPVVLGQVMSANDQRWSVFWARGTAWGSAPDSTGLRLGKHVGEDTDTTRVDELLGYVVMESGQGEVGGVRYHAGVSAELVQGTGNAPPYVVGHQLGGTLTGAVVSAAGMKGGDGGWPVLYGPGSLEGGGLGLAFEEDQMSDLETAHIAERVGYLAVRAGPGIVGQGPSSEIYVRDFQTFERSEFLLAGSAKDDFGIRAVTIAVQNRVNELWLQRDNTWGEAVVRHHADLSVPEAAVTRWIFRQSLPIGNYLVDAEATNVSGVKESAADRMSRQLQVGQDRAVLDPGLRWLTLQFGRSQWGAAGGGTCSPYADPTNGSVFLDEVASFLTKRGYTAQASVPFGQLHPDPSVRKCPWPGVVSSSLDDLVMLRENHGWTFVADSIGPLPSNPSDRPGMSSLTCDDQLTAASASLAELLRFGHARGWGLFAAPIGSLDTGIRDNLASKFYAFSRIYGKSENTQANALTGDWAVFHTVDSGMCNDPTADCYDHYVPGNSRTKRYQLPDELLGYMIANPGAWRGIQFYRLVRGANVPLGYPGTAESPVGESDQSYWDCTSPDPKLHWTSRVELYCYEDFVSIIDRLHTEHPDVITTDTAHVATTWGIDNPNHWTSYPICNCQTNADCATDQRCQGGQCQ
ncbi:MAG: hypothetical protein V2I26_15240 [Halieaceae bacterium]|jgi:hypothetical protein|nr:hypothetical protein [Halieaceae bacterium]